MRNREHARNTRIRKKEYVESLKVQVGEMLQAKAREEREALLESDKISAEVRGAWGRARGGRARGRLAGGGKRRKLRGWEGGEL